MSDARDQIKELVKQELSAAIAQQQSSASSSTPRTRIIDIAPKENAAPAPAQTVIDETIKTVITEDDLRRVPDGSQIRIAPNAVVTPLARDLAEQRHIKVDRARNHRPQSQRPVAIGSDHGGFEMREQLK